MQTRYLRLTHDAAQDETVLQDAAELLRNGELVAFPTETVYGLGANGLDEKAVAEIYRAKGRPSDNPLILHLSDAKDLLSVASAVNANAQALIDAFWPGPLTLVLPRRANVPDCVTGGLETVAVRLPDSRVARRLIELSGVPVAAPSANTSGKPSPTTAQAVLEDLSGRIAAVIDGGACGIGLESTVVDCTTPVPTILRPGGITQEQLEAVLGEVELDAALASPEAKPRAPGMKYKHYAPQAPLFLLEGEIEAVEKKMLQEVCAALRQGKRTGVLADDRLLEKLPEQAIAVSSGSRGDVVAAAAGLYSALRSFDTLDVDVIYAAGTTEKGLGLALMNRLRKASGYHIITVEGGKTDV